MSIVTDEELIRLCEQFCSDLEMCVSHADDAPEESIHSSVYRRHLCANAIAACPAATKEGLKAKALAFSAYQQIFVPSFDVDIAYQIAASIASDLLRY